MIEKYKPSIGVFAHSSWDARSVLACSTGKSPSQLVNLGSRIVVVAPHPDDEIIAIGATLRELSVLGHEILLVAVTDGEGSHQGSDHWTPDRLRQIRPDETAHALSTLGLVPEILRLGLPDGNVVGHEKSLAQLLPLGSTDTVFVPWRHDGHADHEACARAALAACRTVGARCIEYPVWSLVPSHAAHARLKRHRLQQVDVAYAFVEAKRRAMQSFVSQVQPDGETPPVLQEDALNTWRADSEWLMA